LEKNQSFLKYVCIYFISLFDFVSLTIGDGSVVCIFLPKIFIESKIQHSVFINLLFALFSAAVDWLIPVPENVSYARCKPRLFGLRINRNAPNHFIAISIFNQTRFTFLDNRFFNLDAFVAFQFAPSMDITI
jgi:hypothetical protein